MEVWKDIEGYEGRYQVSNLGNVKSLTAHKKGELMIPNKIDNKNHRYQRLRLIDNNRNQKSYMVHRLVAQAFIPNPENKPQVNHINGVRDDNRVENLEWCTVSENEIHAYKIGLKRKRIGVEHPFYGKRHSDETRRKIGDLCRGKALPKLYKPVICTVSNNVYESLQQAAQQHGMTFNKLSARLTGRVKNDTTLRYLNAGS